MFNVGDIGDVIQISAKVTLNDFTIRNGGNNWGDACIDCVSNYNNFDDLKIVDETGSCFGIYLHGSSKNNITDCSITGGLEDGIYIKDSYGNLLYSVKVFKNHDGVQIYNSYENYMIGCIVEDNNDDGIAISGLSNNNSFGFNVITGNNDVGVVIGNSFENVLGYNIIKDNIMEGILLDLSDSNIINDNEISNNYYGIQFDSSNNNYMSYNNISFNLENGIRLYNSSHNNQLIFNTLFNNNDGIRIFNSDNNIIENSTIERNDYGIYFYGLCDDNKVFHNNFIDNNYNAWDEGNNIWDDDYPSGGNYWDDYTGNDTNGDCIGDSPYLVSGGDNMDRYPFMNPNGWINQPPNKPKIYGPIKGKPGVEYSYTAVATDPNCDNIFYMFDWGDGSYSSWLGPYYSGEEANASHTWSKGTYNIKVKAKDTRGLESQWSEPLVITMPRDKSINTPFLNWLHSHPNLFPLLRQLLGL